MRFPASALSNQLQQALPIACLISGDEVLLQEEALDALRTTARTQGFTSRESHIADKSFDAAAAFGGGASLSLFSERKVLELRCPKLPDKALQEALQAALANPDPDCLLVVLTPPLTAKKDSDARWVQAFDQQGWHVQVSAPRDWPAWLRQRATQQGLQIDDAALDQLARACEGNLLAASQLLKLLKLLYDDATVTLEQVQAVAGEDSRFGVFELPDVAMRGDAERSLRILHGLRAEDADGSLRALIPALQRDARQLLGAVQKATRGTALPAALVAQGVWRSRVPLLVLAARRHRTDSLQTLLLQLHQAEQQMKGLAVGEPWDSLETAVLALAGVQHVPA